MPTDINSSFSEVVVSGATETGVSSALAEVVVTPDGNGTFIRSAFAEVVVTPALPVEPPVNPAETVIVESIELETEIHIVPKLKYSPLTGKYNPDEDIDGWLWDRRRVEDSRYNYAQYLSNVGGHSVGLTDGTIKEWWQTGTNAGCAYKGLVGKYVNDYVTWTPQVSRGVYSLVFDSRNLYSDYSYSGVFANDQLENGRMFKILRDDAIQDSIQIALYRRDESFSIFKHLEFQYVEEFTNEIDEIAHSRTSSGLASRKYEYLVQDGRVVLNGNHYISNYFTTANDYPIPPGASPEQLLEGKGENSDTGRNLFLTYLPVQRNSVRLYVDTGSGTLTQLTETSDLAFSDEDELHFQVDHDLGIVTTGGYRAKDIVLKQDISDYDTEIIVFPDDVALSSYPERGVLVIGTEEIAYYSKTARGFGDLYRGYNGTLAEPHSAGATISHRRMGDSIAGNLYVEYIAVPRIDYEVTDEGLRSANKSQWLDIRPISNVETTNILQIYPGDISLDHITLETDTPLLGGNLYGPVYFGSDVSRLTATAYDPRDNPISDISLTIAIIEGSGYLQGSLQQYTDITNTLGEIYSFYNHPLTSSIERRVTSVTHSGGNTLMSVSDLGSDIDVDDIWVFQIVKHDKFFGTVGLPLVVTSEGSATLPYGLYYIDVDGIIDEQDYRDGIISITISGIKYYRNISYVETLQDGSGVDYSRIYLDATLASATGKTVYLLEPDATEWNPDLLNGAKYILYEFSNNAIHPITGNSGAYLPLHPDSVSSNQIVFNNRTLPIPAPSTLSSNLGGYVVIAPQKVSVQAYGTDPVTGRLVESNIIRLQLQLPNFFTGVDSSGILPVPVGWTFPTEEFNIGGGIGGANFITINPQASGINQFSLQIEV